MLMFAVLLLAAEPLLLYARAENGYTTEAIEYFLEIALG